MELEAVKKIIQKKISEHQKFVADAEESERYYANDTDILFRGTGAIDAVNHFLNSQGENPLKSADNRIPQNWHRILIDQKLGYGFTYAPQFDAMKGTQKLDVDFDQKLGTEYESIVKKLAFDASNTGVAWIHYWSGANGIEYYYIDPKQVFVIMDQSSVKEKIKYLIRTYSYLSPEDGETYTTYELWDDKEVRYFNKKTADGMDKLDITFKLTEQKR